MNGAERKFASAWLGEKYVQARIKKKAKEEFMDERVKNAGKREKNKKI